MEQLNYRFLNYKHYSSFLSDLNNNKISEDSIVFIQDKPCIWARGKEYVCIGPNTAVDPNILDNYVTSLQHSQDLATKQNVLTAGNGISISEDTISVDIDMNPITIVSRLPNNPNPDKIYLLQTIEDDDTIYLEYRYINNRWVELGRKQISIDLTPYPTKDEVNSALTHYLSKEEASETYQTITDDYYNKSQVYTKDEIDVKETSMQTAISNETQRATTAEDTISSNVSSEVGRIDQEIETINSNIDDLSSNIEDISENINNISGDIEDINSEIDNLSSDIDDLNSNIESINSQINDINSNAEDLESEIGETVGQERERAEGVETELDGKISTLQDSKQDNLTAGEGININNNIISVDDYIGERDINGKLQTLQQMLGQIYVLKADVYTPEEHTWSEAPIYAFGDIPTSGGQVTPNNTDICALNQHEFDILEQNHEVRNDVCYLITE